MRDSTYQHLGYSRLLNIKDVRDLFGVSYDFIYVLVRERRLRAVSLNGTFIEASEVDEHTRSLRFYPEDVRDFIKDSEIS
jgi:predicted DNA-binding transcriptional regulator AlpA